MSATALAWPALHPDSGESFHCGEIEAQRAVLGKVHGAASDFRWIARSPGFETESRPEAEASTGLENLPLDGGLWRSTEEQCYAVHCYKSRALDQAGRSAALEKQFLACKPRTGLPRALVALLLLERVEDFDDTVWWERRNLDNWRDPAFSLELASERLRWDASRLQQAVKESIARLRDCCPAQAAADFYARLLAGNRPALLEGAPQPLPASALAALLLPLPRRMADRISLAGWIFSSRYDPDSIVRRWDAFACQRRPAPFPPDANLPSDEDKRLAHNWTRALWENAPQAIRQPRREPAKAQPEDDLSKAIRLVGEGAGWAEVESLLDRLAAPLRRLVEFSLERRSWWLMPEKLARNGDSVGALSPQSPEAQLLLACLKRVEKEAPSSVSPKGWEIKADLLRAACLSFSPHPQTLQRAGWPQSPLVPPLLFVPLLRPSDGGQLAQLGPSLKESLRRCGQCPYEALLAPIESFLTRSAGL